MLDQNKVFNQTKNTMKKAFFKLFFPKSRHSRELTPITLKTSELLQNKLNECFTLENIENLKAILRLCTEDFTEQERLTLLLNIEYRKRLIIYCNTHLTEKRYPVHEIKRMFKATTAYAICDAILLHCQMNKHYYLSQYKNNFYPLQSLYIFESMAITQKTYIYENFTLKSDVVC